MHDTPPMTDDERFEMAAAADASERRNRPRHFVVLGAVVLIAGGAALASAWFSNRSERAELDRARTQLAEIRELAGTLQYVRTAARERGPDDEFETPATFLSQLEQYAEDAGLANKPPIPQRRSIPSGSGSRVEWPYNVTDPSLEALLSWVRLSIERIPGTFPHSIEIQPTREQWRMRVTFARYERE